MMRVAVMIVGGLKLVSAPDVPLADGVLGERRAIHSLFGTPDQKEGMAAFIKKCAPTFTHR